MLAALVTAAALLNSTPPDAYMSLRQAPAVITDAGEVYDSLAGVGDFNGDGRADLALTSPSGVTVLYGPLAHGRATVRARLERGGGLEIPGTPGSAEVHAAGDVNGDGLADLLVGVRNSYTAYLPLPAYVVFGRRAGGTVYLQRLGSDGFSIDAPASAGGGNAVLAGGRDVDGDGRADIVVALPDAAPHGRVQAGSVYVVFGRTVTTPVHLDALGADGYRIDGNAGDELGNVVSPIGDVDWDGRAEVAFLTRRSSVQVSYGRAGPGTFDRGSLPGFTVEHVGNVAELADAGDVNGDGRGDLLLGGSYDSDYFGKGTVVPSTGADLDLAQDGASYSVGTECGYIALDDAGDVNGDGLHDTLVGCPTEAAGKNFIWGAAYLLFGRAAPDRIPFPAVIRLDSPAPFCGCDQSGGLAGLAVAGGGDLDGVPGAELAVETQRDDGSGVVYVMSAPHIVVGTNGADRLHGTAGVDLLFGLGGNDTLDGGGGNDTLDGGSGSDRVDGGAGNDLVDGGAGSDVVSGSAGNDDVVGGTGDDVLHGGPGNDTMGGGPGADRLDGGGGTDRVFGEMGNDRVAGGPGNDFVLGDGIFDYWWKFNPPAWGTGRDTILGGPGNDQIWGGGGADTIDGGAGTDTGDGKARSHDGDRVRSVERHRP